MSNVGNVEHGIYQSNAVHINHKFLYQIG